jgi:hypothetical protein
MTKPINHEEAKISPSTNIAVKKVTSFIIITIEDRKTAT